MKRFLELESRDVVMVVSVAMFMAQLDGAVLAIALPNIARDFGVSVISLSLAITIYLTMLVAMLPISGWAADRFGPRRIFLGATVCFALASLCCALSHSFWPFIAARALQGGAAALLTPVGRLLLLRETRKEELVDALAITAMPMLVAPTIGPSLGGFIVDYARWEYIFLINLPIAALLFITTRLRIAHIPGDKSKRLDVVGALLLSIALLILLTGFDRLVTGLSHPVPWLLIGGGLLLFLATLRHLRRHENPAVSLAPMAIPGFRTTAIGAGAAIRIPQRAMLFALPLMFQLGFGFSPFVSGLLLIALNAGDMLTKPWVKPVFDRYGYRTTVFVSSLVGLAALTAITLAVHGTSLVPLLIVGLAICGISRSLVFTAMTSLTFATLSGPNISSGNVLASISMQLFNTVAISATAVLLSIFAQLNGHGEPAMWDYRATMIVVILIGLGATFQIRPQLPHDLSEVHAQDPV